METEDRFGSSSASPSPLGSGTLQGVLRYREAEAEGVWVGEEETGLEGVMGRQGWADLAGRTSVSARTAAEGNGFPGLAAHGGVH